MRSFQCILRSVAGLVAGLLLLPSFVFAHPSYAPHVHAAGAFTSAESFIVFSVPLILLLAGVALAIFAKSRKL